MAEGGHNLPVGQRQRIALGRALLGNPLILLLDEPTARLDPAAREDVWRVLARHHGTVLMASQDPHEIGLADDVWVLDSGRVVETLSGVEWRRRHWDRQVRGPWEALAIG